MREVISTGEAGLAATQSIQVNSVLDPLSTGASEMPDPPPLSSADPALRLHPIYSCMLLINNFIFNFEAFSFSSHPILITQIEVDQPIV